MNFLLYDILLLVEFTDKIYIEKNFNIYIYIKYTQYLRIFIHIYIYIHKFTYTVCYYKYL